jgi:hypothetical protein
MHTTQAVTRKTCDGRLNLGYLDVDGRIILKLILKKQVVRV